MYRFARTGRLTGPESLAWARKIGARAAKVTGRENVLWASTFSPGLGNVAWVSFWDDFETMGAAFSELGRDAKFAALSAEGVEHVRSIDDRLSNVLYDSSADAGSPRYLWETTGVLRAGAIARGVLVGIEIAMKYHDVTGRPSVFARDLSGDFGGVRWFLSYDSLADVDTAEGRTGADLSWVELLDSSEGCYVDGAGTATSTIYQRVG
ncbi:MAG: hypothetical protein ACRDV0_04480 [Acidimicrobiales bacterium]